MGENMISVTLSMVFLVVLDGLVWVFQKLVIAWDSQTTASKVNTEWCQNRQTDRQKNIQWAAALQAEMNGQRRIVVIVWADKKATVTQMSLLYNHKEQGEKSLHYTT